MNKLQRHNQRVIRDTLNQARLIRSIDVANGHVVEIQTQAWGGYWEGCGLPARELEQLNATWLALIEDEYSARRRDAFVRAYFALLHMGLEKRSRGEIGLHVLRKVVAFETFYVCGKRGSLAAGILNVRNPAYMLSRIASPNARDDPKYLPLICPFSGDAGTSGLYCHYRRISLGNSGNIQLFIYPPVEPSRQSVSYSLIGRLFKSLTAKNDPRVKKRSKVLFDCVFDKLLVGCKPDHIRLLDVACGSARLTVELCKKAFEHRQKSFDLTLVDVVRGNRSLAGAFCRNPSVFCNLVFRQESLFDWVEGHSNNPPFHFDIVLMLRVFDIFSRFHIETMSPHEMVTLIRRDRENIAFTNEMLAPAKLIESNMYHKIQHTIKRTRLRRGSMFYQFSLSDYFKVMYMVMGGKVDEGNDVVYVPIRRFDDNVFVLPSGRSLIGQLMEVADRIVIEDGDLRARHLRRHIDEFGLSTLRVTDMSDRQRMRGASLTLVDKRS